MKVIDINDFCIPAEDASYDELSNFADEIAELATDPIEAEPVRHGRWLINKEDGWITIAPCSVCGGVQDVDFPYCPNCGAQMEV